MSFMNKPSDEILKLIILSGSLDKTVALQAQRELAKAIELPLRQAVLVGDNLSPVFERIVMPLGVPVEWPLDLLAPGEEDDYVAYTNPGNGRIAERQVEGDYVQVPTYGVTNGIDWLLRFAREARYDVVSRALQVFQAGFVKKLNDDGWHTVITAAVDRNILVYDADASQGQFTKRLVSLLKTVMIRNGGGNTGSLRRAKLTDLFLSPEALEDVRNWGLDQIDEMTRREIYLASDDSPKVTRVFGVNLNPLDEFGEGQQYQNFFTTQLGGSIHASDSELVIGLDLQNNDSFVSPIKQEISVFEDEGLHRQQRAGYYGWAEVGYAVLDGRRVIAASF